MKERIRSISKTEGKYSRRVPDEEDLPPCGSESGEARDFPNSLGWKWPFHLHCDIGCILRLSRP